MNIILLANKRTVGIALVGAVIIFFLILLENAAVIPLRIEDLAFLSVLIFFLALYRTSWVFILFIGTIPLETIMLTPPNFGLGVRPYQLLGLVLVLAMIAKYFSKRLNFQIARLVLPDLFLFLLFIGSLLSFIGSANKALAFKQSVVLASFLVIYWIVRNYIQDARDFKKIIPMLLVSGAVISLYAIWQNWRFMNGLESFEVMPGRPNSTFPEPDWLGMYATFAIALIFSIIYHLNHASESNPGAQITNYQFSIFNQFSNIKIFKLTCYALLTTCYVVLVLSVARSAWIGAGLVTIVYLKLILTQGKFSPIFWRWKKMAIESAFIVISLAISIGAINIFDLTNFQLFNRATSISGLQKITVSCIPPPTGSNWGLPDKIISTDELEKFGCRHINLEDIEEEKSTGNIVTEIDRFDPNVGIRKKIYQSSWNEIKNNPIFGIGWGSIGKILGSDERGTQLNSSNIFLEVWLGAGIIGIVSFVALWIWIVWNSATKFINARESDRKTIFMFSLLGALAILVPNMFNAGIFLGFFWMYLAIAVSLNLSSQKY